MMKVECSTPISWSKLVKNLSVLFVAMKKSNLQHHYGSCHGNLEKLAGQSRQDKIAFLKRSLNAQQTALQRYCKTDNDIIQTSYEISELIAKKLKLHIEGEFVKECIVAAAKLIALEKVAVFEKISLSRRTVSSRIQEMGDNIEKTLKDKAQDFEFFALHCIAQDFDLPSMRLQI